VNQSSEVAAPQAVDLLIVGGGTAGLSLAYQVHQQLPELSMLIVDEAVKKANDHTWCFWHRDSSYLESVAYRQRKRLAVLDRDGHLTLELAPYRRTTVHSSSFYATMRTALSAAPNVQFALGTVKAIGQGADGPEVVVNELEYRATWAFDSRHRSADYRPLSRQRVYLSQHFVGWEIETDRDAFDPTLPTLFDFRTPQLSTVRFFICAALQRASGACRVHALLRHPPAARGLPGGVENLSP
jgi:lycopene beta-cyclase